MLIVGIWIEKGMGMIVPAFIPTPLGEIVEYLPTLNETLVTLGIWAGGLLIYTILVRVTVPVLTGRLTHRHRTHQPRRLRGRLQRLPPAARVRCRPGAPPRHLRQVPHGPRPPAD
jgi:hypothetical protein